MNNETKDADKIDLSRRASDVVMKILYCGVCHSDLHQVRNTAFHPSRMALLLLPGRRQLPYFAASVSSSSQRT